MKKFIALLSAIMLAGCASSQTAAASTAKAAVSASATAAASAPAEASAQVDSYTSASLTRTLLTGSDLAAAEETLASVSSDLASKADTEKAGYAEPANAIMVQIMSVNPDGTPGMSTIHAWKYSTADHTVDVELTDGQNAENLRKEGSRGTILAHVDDTYYLIHLNTSKTVELKYTDDAYNNGEFNSAYSGKDNQLSEFDITFSVLSIESTQVYMFN